LFLQSEEFNIAIFVFGVFFTAIEIFGRCDRTVITIGFGFIYQGFSELLFEWVSSYSYGYCQSVRYGVARIERLELVAASVRRVCRLSLLAQSKDP
jgi:hypothetical protein